MKNIELIEKRKPCEKHFLQKDGTICAEIYTSPIHYFKNGKYEEIDNSLVKRKDVLVNKSNEYKVEFKEDYQDSLMRISKKDYYIDFRIKESNGLKLNISKREISKENRNTTFCSISDDVSVKHQVLSNKVKESVVLTTSRYSKFSFDLDTNLDLKEENGEIVAFNNEGEEIFRIEQPYMIDSNDAKCDNVYYCLQKEKDGYVLTISLDEEWLKKSERVFPIIVDPTVSSATNEISLEDTYIYPGDTNDVRYNKEYIKAGVERVNGQDRQNMGLIKFSLPDLATGSNIVNAEMILTSYISPYYSDETYVEVHEITDSWNSTEANWNNMQGKFANNIEATSCFERTHPNSYYPYSMTINITRLVKKWYEEDNNNGLMIKSCNTNYIDDNYQMYFSNENTVNSSIKPIVTITYRNNNGIESFLDYNTHTFSGGSSLINTYNGNVVNIFNLASTVGGNFPAHVNLIYNTNDVVLNKESFFGKGFKLNYEEEIEVVSSDLLKHIDGSGAVYFYNKVDDSSLQEGESKYVDEENLKMEIIKTNNRCVLTDQNKNEKVFLLKSNKYLLSSITDNRGNQITISFNNDNSIHSISDKFGKSIDIVYENNRIQFVTENETTILNFENNKLIEISRKKGNIDIEYYSNGVINSITDISGLKIAFEYCGKTPYRVSKVSQYGVDNSLGKYYTIQYGYNSTQITDNLGKIEVLAYNDFGNLISRSTLKGQNEVLSAYSREKAFGTGDTKNKIVSDMIPFRYTKNYLSNNSFESDANYFTPDNGITMSFDSNNYRTGTRCLKISTNVANKSITHNITLEKGKYYTFSGYFLHNTKASISLSYEDDNSNIVVKTQDISKSMNFEKEEVSIYYDDSAVSDLSIVITLNETGDLYIDDIQLEDGENSNNFNLFDNSDFSNGFDGWEKSACYPSGEPTQVGNCMSIVSLNSNNDKALKVETTPLKVTTISRKFDIKGTTDDVFTLSFWYKNEGIPPFTPYTGCTVRILFEPYDNNYGQCLVVVPLPITSNGIWQHFTHREAPPTDFKSITITFTQTISANDFYLTGLSFYKDMKNTNYSYDEFGNVISIGENLSGESEYKYDKNNRLIQMTTPVGKKLKYEYDKNVNGRIINAISSSGIANQVKFDSNGNPIKTISSKKYLDDLIDGNYYIREMGTFKYVKAEMNLVLLEENDCSNTIWIFEKIGDYYKIKNYLNPSYHLVFDNSQVFLGTSNTNCLFSVNKTDDGNYIIRCNNQEESYLCSNNDRIELNNATDSSSATKFYIEMKNNVFLENTSNYTSDGRFTSNTVNSNLTKTTYSVDSQSGLVNSIIDTNNHMVEYQYDNKDRLIEISFDGKQIEYDYTSNNLLKEISQNNKLFELFYDNYLNLKKVSLNGTITFIENFYNQNNGELNRVKFGNNDEIFYSYDSFGRLSEVEKMDDTYHFLYDNTGILSKIVSNNHEKKYYYDIGNKLYRYKNDDLEAKYLYAPDETVTKKMYSIGNCDFSQELLFTNDLPSTVVLDNSTISYLYDNLERVISKNINNLITSSYEYVDFGKRTTHLIKSYTIGGKTYCFEYDGMGNITKIYLNNNLIKEYEYNSISELIKEINYDDNNMILYSYDGKGNLSQKTTKDYSTNSVIKNDSYIYNNLQWEDQLTSYNNESITYDLIGNPISIGNKTLTWINGKELETYSDLTNNLLVSYKYNENGIRESKIVNNVETKYYLANKDIIAEQKNNSLIYYLYDLEGIIGLNYNGTQYFFEKNVQNDIIGIVNALGERVVTYKYDSWGNILRIEDELGHEITNSSNIGIINPFRYRSYYYDQETGLYYLGSRYYNPMWGRFISPDSIIGANQDILSNNLYSYVSNNPINNYDSDGQSLKSLIKSINKVVKTIKTKLSKTVGKYIGITKSTTLLNNTSLLDFIMHNAFGGYYSESSITYTSNVVSSNSPVSVDYNNTNYIDRSCSFQIDLPNAGTISYSVGPQHSTMKYDGLFYDGIRSTFEAGYDFTTVFFQFGSDKKDGNVIKSEYQGFSVSKMMIILAVSESGLLVEIPAKASEIVSSLYYKVLPLLS